MREGDLQGDLPPDLVVVVDRRDKFRPRSPRGLPREIVRELTSSRELLPRDVTMDNLVVDDSEIVD